MFRNLKLKYSILLGYTIPLVLSVVTAVIVYGYVGTVTRLSESVERAHGIVENGMGLSQDISDLQRSVRGYLLLGEGNDLSLRHFEESVREYRGHAELLSRDVRDPGQAAILQKILDIIRRIEEISRNEVALVKEGKQAKALQLFREDRTLALGKEADDWIDQFLKKEIEIKNERARLENVALNQLSSVLMMGVLLSIVLAVFFGFLVASRISRTISIAVGKAASTSTEIVATITQHERTASQQASMVAETTATMDELSATARQSAEQADSAAGSSKKAAGMTEEGSESVKEAILAMDGLKDGISGISEQIRNLSEQAGRIGGIAELVKDLSTQINMLALNAAVEAARAGEYGKGFAVVAAEVRKLSVESKKAAEQARTIISGVQKATESAIARTEEGVKRAEDVTEIARKMGSLFDRVNEVTNEVYNNAQQVLQNVKQQSFAIGQVVEAVSGINAGARETAAGFVQTKIGLKNLDDAASELDRLV